MSILNNVKTALIGNLGVYEALAGATLALAAVGGIAWYGHDQYEAGIDAEHARVESLQRTIEIATQEAKDRADAQYRGAIIARQAAETKLSASTTRISGLLQQLRNRPKATPAVSGSDGAGDDWIGIFGQCVGRYESVGKDAARLADKVTGLQGYVKSLQAR